MAASSSIDANATMTMLNGRRLRCRSCWMLTIAYSIALSFFLRDAFAFSVAPRRETVPTTTATADPGAIQRILDSVEQEHDEEVVTGLSFFEKEDLRSGNEWTDQDFVARSVGVGNAGPDESALQRGHEIFESVEPVVSKDECESLISEARDIIAHGLEEEGMIAQNAESTPTNSQLGEARVSQMPRAKEWLRKALHGRFFPILESRFGIPADELTLHDALIIGYGYFGGAVRSQPVHRDSSLLSLNVALSSQSSFDPDGGGTFFEGLAAEESVIKTEQGHVLCHASGAPHAGRGIANGQRWVLVLFCLAKNQPQLARRCHARGVIERGKDDLEEAGASFRAGLTVAPRDHLLLSSLGGVHMAKGEKGAAQSSLSAAALAYEHCQKANIGLGRMMLAAGRPRAALRRFEAVLEWMDERDRAPGVWMPLRAIGWDARVYGAQAAIECAVKAKRLGVNFFSSSKQLQTAIERLNVALEAVPGNENILNMISKAKEIMQEDLNA